jgi:2'-5' RNA ligase
MKREEGMSLYTLVLMPNDRIIGCVKNFKERSREILDKRYGSEKRILAGARPFKVQFDGFSSFKESDFCTFFVRLTSDAEKTAVEITSFLEIHFDKRLRKNKTADWKKIHRLHMTVVRNVAVADVVKCEDAFKEEAFNDFFNCSSLALRKLNLAKGQYDILDSITLLGNEYVVGQQTKMFDIL